MFLTTGILRAGGEFLNLKTGIPGGPGAKMLTAACGKYRKLPKSSKNYSILS